MKWKWENVDTKATVFFYFHPFFYSHLSLKLCSISTSLGLSKNWVPISRKLKSFQLWRFCITNELKEWAKYLTIFGIGSLKKTIEGKINEEIIKAEQLVSSLVCCFVVYFFFWKRLRSNKFTSSSRNEKGAKTKEKHWANNWFWSCDKDALKIIIFRIRMNVKEVELEEILEF